MHFVWDSMRSVKADACNAGVDIQRDVLDLMGFKPLMPQVKDMDGRCFSKWRALPEELFVLFPFMWCSFAGKYVYPAVGKSMRVCMGTFWMYVATECCFSLPVSMNCVYRQTHTYTCCRHLNMNGIVWSVVENRTTNSVLMGPTRYLWSSVLYKVITVSHLSRLAYMYAALALTEELL